MAEIEFYYKGNQTKHYCYANDKMKDFIQKFVTGVKIDKENLCFLYGTDKINEELTFDEQADAIDKKRLEMNLLVKDIEEKDPIANTNSKKTDYVKCPKCEENVRIDLQLNGIKFYGCKNLHKEENIQLKDFFQTQIIDESKIICQNCSKISKKDANKDMFYKCLFCSLNLCQNCESIHNKEHYIIDYNQQKFICNNHYEPYDKYCSSCKKDICIICEKNHSDHDIIPYSKIKPNVNKLKQKIDELKEKIDNYKEKIKENTAESNNNLENLCLYYKIVNYLFDNYKIRKRNYYTLQNLQDIIVNIRNFIQNFDDINLPNEDDSKGYKDFDIKKIKLIKSMKIKDEFESKELVILKDFRLVTKSFSNKTKKSTIFVVNLDNNSFDIKYDIDNYIIKMIKMDDEHIIILFGREIKIIKIDKNEIQFVDSIKLEKDECNYENMVYLSKNKVFVARNENSILFSYEKGKLTFEKNLTSLYLETFWVRQICKINENKIALLLEKDWKESIRFYDLKNDEFINSFVQDGGTKTKEKNLCMLNKDILVYPYANKFILFDVEKCESIRIITFSKDLSDDEHKFILPLTEKYFLCCDYHYGVNISKFEFIDGKGDRFKYKILLKEANEKIEGPGYSTFTNGAKYKGGSLIFQNKNELFLYS